MIPHRPVAPNTRWSSSSGTAMEMRRSALSLGEGKLMRSKGFIAWSRLNLNRRILGWSKSFSRYWMQFAMVRRRMSEESRRMSEAPSESERGSCEHVETIYVSYDSICVAGVAEYVILTAYYFLEGGNLDRHRNSQEHPQRLSSIESRLSILCISGALLWLS